VQLAVAETDRVLNNILGLIPARGGSSGIPRKNIAVLAGRPLLAYTCEAALGSRRLTRVLLSTDDPEIAEVGRACGVEVPFCRPAELARADSPSLRVAQHAVRWLIEHEGRGPDIVVLLQPTSPLRRAQHIDEAMNRMEETGADSIVSVVPVPHRYTPYCVLQLRDDSLQDFCEGALPFDRFRRQDLPVLYARNGPAILAAKVSVLLESQSFYGQRVLPYVMSEEDSVDIDAECDLQFAEWLLRRQRATSGW
jgi:CMP-N-acetylneuraminic acid synthetase